MRLLLALLLTLSFNVFANRQGTAVLAQDQTATGAGVVVAPLGTNRTFHGIGSVTAATGASTVDIEVSNDNVNWISKGTLTFTLGTTVTSQVLEHNLAYKWCRANVKTISGTGAKVSVFMGSNLE